AQELLEVEPVLLDVLAEDRAGQRAGRELLEVGVVEDRLPDRERGLAQALRRADGDFGHLLPPGSRSFVNALLASIGLAISLFSAIQSACFFHWSSVCTPQRGASATYWVLRISWLFLTSGACSSGAAFSSTSAASPGFLTACS